MCLGEHQFWLKGLVWVLPSVCLIWNEMWDYFQENKNINNIFSYLLFIYLGQLLNWKYAFQGTRWCLRAKCPFRCSSTGLQVAMPGFPKYLQEDRDDFYSLHEKSVLANKEKISSLSFPHLRYSGPRWSRVYSCRCSHLFQQILNWSLAK